MAEDEETPAVAGQPRIEVRRSARRRRTVTAFRDGDRIVVLVPHRLPRRDEAVLVEDVVGRLLAREARVRTRRTDARLHARARELASTYLEPRLGIQVEATAVVWVTNQHQRWGSCTPSTRVIRLSQRLQTMPDWVVDYVLLHELVHLVEPGHTERFWALVGAMPAAERAKGYLEGFQAARAQPDDGLGADVESA